MLSASCSPWWASCLPWRPCAHGDGYQCGWSAGRCGRSPRSWCCGVLGMIGDVQQIASGESGPLTHQAIYLALWAPLFLIWGLLWAATAITYTRRRAPYRDHNQPGGSHARVRRREQAIRQPPGTGRLFVSCSPWAAHRLPRTKRGREDHGDADGVRTGRARQWCRALAGSHRARTAGAVRLHAGGAWPVPCGSAISSSTSAGSAAVRARR